MARSSADPASKIGRRRTNVQGDSTFVRRAPIMAGGDSHRGADPVGAVGGDGRPRYRRAGQPPKKLRGAALDLGILWRPGPPQDAKSPRGARAGGRTGGRGGAVRGGGRGGGGRSARGGGATRSGRSAARAGTPGRGGRPRAAAGSSRLASSPANPTALTWLARSKSHGAGGRGRRDVPAGRHRPRNGPGVPGDLVRGEVGRRRDAGQQQRVEHLVPGAEHPLRPVDPGAVARVDALARRTMTRTISSTSSSTRLPPIPPAISAAPGPAGSTDTASAVRGGPGVLRTGGRFDRGGRRGRREWLGQELILQRARRGVAVRHRVERDPADAAEEHLRPGQRVRAGDRAAAGRRAEADHDPGRQAHQPAQRGERGGELLRRAPLRRPRAGRRTGRSAGSGTRARSARRRRTCSARRGTSPGPAPAGTGELSPTAICSARWLRSGGTAGRRPRGSGPPRRRTARPRPAAGSGRRSG